MIKVFLIAAVSADGKIAERTDQNSLDWTSKEDTKFFVERTREAGALIMGRKTFATIGRPLKNRLNVVLTSDVSKIGSDLPAAEDGLLEYTSLSPKELVANLDQRGYKEVAICGGSSVYSQFLREGLIEELYLTVEPVLFGSGVSLTADFPRMNLELIDTSMLGDQSVLLHYRVKS